jgi:hypothetical protein
MLVAARKSEMIIILHSSLDDCQSLDDNSDTIPVHASDSKDGNSEKSSTDGRTTAAATEELQPEEIWKRIVC